VVLILGEEVLEEVTVGEEAVENVPCTSQSDLFILQKCDHVPKMRYVES